jgi:hypothetical protein
MSSEFRRRRRRQIQETVLVTDAMTDAVVGRIAILSDTGMLLIAAAPLTEDALYQFRFRLVDARGVDADYELGAHLLWKDDQGTPGMTWTGLRFIAIPEDQAQRLRDWIGEPTGQPAPNQPAPNQPAPNQPAPNQPAPSDPDLP